MDAGKADVAAVAAAIRRYLNEHPNAADTVEGIARWWLSGSSGNERLADVERAMELLVLQGNRFAARWEFEEAAVAATGLMALENLLARASRPPVLNPGAPVTLDPSAVVSMLPKLLDGETKAEAARHSPEVSGELESRSGG